VSRKVIKRKKMKSFAKIMWPSSAAASPPLDPTTLRSAGTSPLVLDIVVKTILAKQNRTNHRIIGRVDSLRFAAP